MQFVGRLLGHGLDPAREKALFIFIFKKTKFQKYMSNREIFKNGCLSPPNGRQGVCRPSSERQNLNVKKITFRSWRPWHIKQ